MPSRPSDRFLAVLILGVLVVGLVAARGSDATRAAADPPATTSLRLTSQVAPQVVTVAPTKAPVRKQKVVRSAAVTKRVVRRPAAPVVRWLPSGTGMWLHEFDRTQGGNGRAIVQRARAAGLTHLFVQTGSSRMGPIGSPALRQILPATRGTGIRVIAWDFANLHNPEADARRLAMAARFRCGGCPRIAAVAPDIETAAEGTRINGSNVIRYYNELRHWLPRDVSVLATVPWPSEVRRGHYPYASTARRADAILPMAYWYNRSPAAVTAQSMAYFRKFHKPVMPVGQGYDGRLDAPYLAPDPHPYLSVRSFLLTAKQWGARSVSLWSWQTTGNPQWRALIKARSLYRG
ncbi:MAG: hypothetical protein JWL79_2826 [Frankiales bacterium]|nr:hypothetical protein [Frankiales bacterium]